MQKPDLRDELSLEFELGMYELGRDLYPRNTRVLDGLVTTYAAAGRRHDSLAVVLRLIEMEPRNPRHYYNRACNQCCLGQREQALESLEYAVEIGFEDFDFMTRDPDLVPLHSEPAFREFQRRATVRKA
jgi:adenylate cyclase